MSENSKFETRSVRADDCPHPLRKIPALLRTVSETLIVPRWCRLQAEDVELKSAGEWVTTVDREVEEKLSVALQALIPGSFVVGEEQCALTPSLLDRIDTGLVWLLDPLDGTGNFVAGHGPVSVMLALLEDGVTVAGWMLNPLTGEMYHARKGGGAWRNDHRIVAMPPSSPCGRGIVKTRFLPDDVKRHMAQAGASLALQPGSNCAGDDYPNVMLADIEFALYWRVLPWDHAPGALFVTEAGGVVARLDGRAYQPSEQTPGLLVARSQTVWDMARELLVVAAKPQAC